MDERVKQIAENAAHNISLNEDDIRYLVQIDPNTQEAAFVAASARDIAHAANGGVGFIHAQIGVDAYPCPENCHYCSFAAMNKLNEKALRDGKADIAPNADNLPLVESKTAQKNTGAAAHSSSDTRKPNKTPVQTVSQAATGTKTNEHANVSFEVPLEEIIENARIFDEAGVHLISLMSTAGLAQKRFLEMIRAVRAAVSDDMAIMANTADLSLEDACALKEAGAQAAYHAIRLGEGVITDISPDVRRATIAHIHKAGLALMSGIEPIWEGADENDLVSRIAEMKTLHPYCTGACMLHAVKGTAMEGEKEPTPKLVAHIGAVVRLAVGTEVPVGGAGGTVWVDAGCDARSRGRSQNRERIIKEVSAARTTLQKRGWHVPDRPNASWFDTWVKKLLPLNQTN